MEHIFFLISDRWNILKAEKLQKFAKGFLQARIVILTLVYVQGCQLLELSIQDESLYWATYRNESEEFALKLMKTSDCCILNEESIRCEV